MVPAQEARCFAIGNRDMPAPVSATITSAVSGPITWDGADQVAEATKGLHDFLDPVGQLVDRGRVPIDQVQVELGQEGVVVGEPADQGLGQLRGSWRATGAVPGQPSERRPGIAHG